MYSIADESLARKFELGKRVVWALTVLFCRASQFTNEPALLSRVADEDGREREKRAPNSGQVRRTPGAACLFLPMLEVVSASGRAFPFFIVGIVLLLFVPLLLSAERLQEICRFLIAALGTIG